MYYVTPHYSVAINPKTGCTSFAYAILATFYPELFASIAAAPVFCGPAYIAACPATVTPIKPVVCLVRDPAARFASALRQTQLDPAAAVAALAQDAYCRFPTYSKPRKIRADAHFVQQARLAVGPAFLFKFPEDLPAAARFIGIRTPLLNLNSSDVRIELTPAQIDVVHAYYREDLQLYRKLCRPPRRLLY